MLPHHVAPHQPVGGAAVVRITRSIQGLKAEHETKSQP